jgi:nitrogen regulatory protein P-II 2
VVSPEVAAAVFDLLAEKYFPHYAVIAWQTEVEVLRGDKFA